ncbi:EAL domain-containing protein [Bosea sp. CRIB-10]|nr:EAL domain-containing protein [Bosea sp. CRIB-10]
MSNLPESSADLAIVEGVIGIAHALGKSVTAEGVETLEQASLLMDLGCDFLQGWYFAKASNRERLPHILANLPPVPSPADDEMLSTVSRLPAGRLGA